MSIVDKVIAAVTPPESAQARAEARSKARAAAGTADWLAQILDHHVQIEAQFQKVKEATESTTQRAELKLLGALLTGHSMAEEAAIYPALAAADEKGHATTAYTEQSAAKLQMGLLEMLPPLSQEFMDKLEHIRGAVAHHVYEEEGNWFVDLAHSGKVDQARLTVRYQEEFERYMGSKQSQQSERRADVPEPASDVLRART
jgi:hypothetical protein